jgi:hypothetical protein
MLKEVNWKFPRSGNKVLLEHDPRAFLVAECEELEGRVT